MDEGKLKSELEKADEGISSELLESINEQIRHLKENCLLYKTKLNT